MATPKKVNINDVLGWLNTADQVFKTPFVRDVLLPILKPLLPAFGLTAEDIAKLDRQHADIARRTARRRGR
jgi:hypothetical protein